MGFLDNYLTVNQKVKLVHEKFPNHRLIVDIVSMDLDLGRVLIKGEFYRDAADEKPAYTDFAFGNVASYPSQMKRWFVEDTSTSCIGRICSTALALDEKPNREQMEQIEREKTVSADVWATPPQPKNVEAVSTTIAQIAETLGDELMPEAPQCKHGHRIFRTGEKNGREWGGWYCSMKEKKDQCEPVWAVRSATTGNWRVK